MLISMTPEETARYGLAIDRYESGLECCRSRVRQSLADAPRLSIPGLHALEDMSTGLEHDVDYFAWEVGRTIKLALSVAEKSSRSERLLAAIEAVLDAGPEVIKFRNAVTHMEDNRAADGVTNAGLALRVLDDDSVAFVVDPLDYDLTMALHELLAAIRSDLA